MPVISVLMGTYNESEKQQIRTAIDSILGQTFRDFEFIICDDGSEPEFYEWLQKFCKKDARIRLMRNKQNRGLAYTLNRCFFYSSGRYIARMDADDISLPQRLEKQAAFLDANEKYALTGCNVGMIDESSIWGKRKLKEQPEKMDFLNTSPFVHPTVMMRREVMERLHGYSSGKQFLRVEDNDFFMRVYESGYIGYNLQEILFLYRETAASYGKRKYWFRINEYRVRCEGFRKLGILKGNMRCALKPLVAGAVPVPVMQRCRLRKYGRGCRPVKLESFYRMRRRGKGKIV